MTFLTCSMTDLPKQVEAIQFAKEDVLPTVHDRMKRLACLIKAISLEGMSSSSVTLWIQGEALCLRVTSRVIAASNHQIILENGLRLPIKTIRKVTFNR